MPDKGLANTKMHEAPGVRFGRIFARCVGSGWGASLRPNLGAATGAGAVTGAFGRHVTRRRLSTIETRDREAG